MFTVIELTSQDIVVGHAIASTASKRVMAAQPAEQKSCGEGDSALTSVGAFTGFPATTSVALQGARHSGTGSAQSSKSLGGHAFGVASPISACSMSITFIPRKRIGRLTVERQTPVACCSGVVSFQTCSCFAPTVTASKLTKKLGRRAPTRPDIACRRVEEAWKQPRLFEEPAPKPQQLSLIDGDAA